MVGMGSTPTGGPTMLRFLCGMKKAWPLISAANYKPERKPREDLNEAVTRIVREATEER